MRRQFEGAAPMHVAMLKSFPSEVRMPLQFEAPQSTALYERLRLMKQTRLVA